MPVKVSFIACPTETDDGVGGVLMFRMALHHYGWVANRAYGR
jgi:hypothetical protein